MSAATALCSAASIRASPRLDIGMTCPMAVSHSAHSCEGSPTTSGCSANRPRRAIVWAAEAISGAGGTGAAEVVFIVLSFLEAAGAGGVGRRPGLAPVG